MQNTNTLRIHSRTVLVGIVIANLAATGLESGANSPVQEAFDIGIIESTMPPDGYVYPGQDIDAFGNVAGLDRFTVTFSARADLTPSMISVEVAGDDVPAVASVQPLSEEGSKWEIRLDSPIPPGESTTFRFPGDQTIVLSAVPTDVNQDGFVSVDDQIDFLDAYHSSSTDPLYHDIDANGIVDAADYQRLIELQQGIDSTDVWFTDSGGDPPKNTVVCCVAYGMCVLYLAPACPAGTDKVDCPCSLTQE